MKKILFLLLVVPAMNFAIFTGCCFGQWEEDVRLSTGTMHSFLSSPNARCIAAYLNTIHVVWSDTRDGNDEIYYKRSSDGGTTWGADTRLTYDSALSRYPSIAVNGQDVHVAWHDERFNREIYYKHSTDGGNTWGEDIRLTYNWAGSWYPSIAVSGQNVYIVWHDERDSSACNIYFKSSTDNGITWSADIPITQRSSYSTYPSITVVGPMLHVVWRDERISVPLIYYRRSTNAGANWQSEFKLTDDSTMSPGTSISSITSSGQFVHSVWWEQNNGKMKICYRRSTNAGVNWMQNIRFYSDSTDIIYPSIFASASNVHIAMLSSNGGLYYCRSGDDGANWETLTRISPSSAKHNPYVCASGQAVHVIWNENIGKFNVYYKKNPTANVGIENISSETPSSYSLFQNYPNPFNSSTTIEFSIPKASNVRLRIFDMLGREISLLIDKRKTAGIYKYRFDGGTLSSGIYFYRLETDYGVQSKRLMMIK